MLFLKKYITLLSLMVLFQVTTVAQQRIHVVPNPQEVEFKEGAFFLDEVVSVDLYLNDKEEEAFQFDLLQREYQSSTGGELIKGKSETKKRITIGIKGGGRAFDRLVEQYGLKADEQIGEEGYLLLITSDQIIISSNTKRGAFYGVQTLNQLIRSQRNTGSIPAVEIKDWPDLEIRAIMDDISRGPVPTKAYMQQQIERMAEMKINMLTYYTEHVVKTKSHPVFAPEGGALDIEEWAELADYAKKYHIDLVGNFQSFGHFDQILKHPEYAHLGESGMLLSPAFDESYELLEDIYSEMIPAFHSDYFHINSDETFDLGKGASKAMVDSLGEGVVYANHIKRLHEIVSGMGKRVFMWGDIVLKHPEILEMLPEDIIPVTWGYDIMDDYAPHITPFIENDFDLLVSTGVLNSFSVMPDFNTARGNIGGFIAEAVKQGAWGMMNTVWDDGGFALFSRDWYGVSYAADQSWNSAPDDESYDTRFNHSVYGATNNGLSEAISTLNELAKLKSTEKMNEAILWNQVIPEKGESVLMNIKDWPKVMKLADKADMELKKYDPIKHKGDVRYIQQVIDLYKYLASSRPGLIQAARYYREAELIGSSKKNKARNNMVEAYDLISENFSELSRLKKENEALWVNENRVYALDRVVAQYDGQLEALKELKDLLLSAMYDFDKGNSLPGISEIRLDIQESEGWYFQGWLMIEPIPNPGGFADPGVDHLQGMSGIEKTFPTVTQEFYYDDVKYRWRRVNTPYFAKVDLDELHGESDNVVIYAFAHIDIIEDRTVRAVLGSSDGIEVYVNGQSVYKKYEEREFELDQDELFLPLHEGRNHLMIRITNTSGDWAFSFSLPDSEMRSYKNRYKIIE
ncbi:MAG: beta-N-acetylhexosaminidase [Balneolaceae bacterium]